MPDISLPGCASSPLGSYLKAIGVFRLVAAQADCQARLAWNGQVPVLSSSLSDADLLDFFLNRYVPTPVVAPWNGGSGFYPKDNKTGINAIATSTHTRFAPYRHAIEYCQSIAEVKQGKLSNATEEDLRRTAILKSCRNHLPDASVEWLDAAIGIASDGKRAFSPILGTGGNEGRLDYTNNFMSRIAALLIDPSPKLDVPLLLKSALTATPVEGLQPDAAGQFDPGRAGGPNQGPGVEHDGITNPWDFVLTIEGAVAWASGIFRRQGIGYRTILCSPFTVHPASLGYGSASANDEARAEIWTPLWVRPVFFPELKLLLREGRANLDGRPAKNGIEFAEAACSLGVDRGIDRFVRYSLLKRRGDSYVALPAGTFPAGYRSESDRIREFRPLLDSIARRNELSKHDADLVRSIENAIFSVLLNGGADRMRELMAALGRLLRRLASTRSKFEFPRALDAAGWIIACGFDSVEVRIAAALSSIYDPDAGPIHDNLRRSSKTCAWEGSSFPLRLVALLKRRLLSDFSAEEKKVNAVGAALSLHPADAVRFIDHGVDDVLIEDLLFAFTALDWKDFSPLPFRDHAPRPATETILPLYALIKCVFLPGLLTIPANDRSISTARVRADPQILSLLIAGRVQEAASIAVRRLRIAGAPVIDVAYSRAANPARLAAALTIPVRADPLLSSGAFSPPERRLTR